MQLIVTCAGCGAKYRGESGPKKFRCAACSNLFTFPDQPKSASAGTILCSNCWTETVPTEKLKTCGFCSQRVSPRYGGVATEDKQVKVKQPSVRNDPNLVKAVTRPNPSSSEIPVGGGAQPPSPDASQPHFVSSEWKEIGVEQKSDMPDPKKTQAFELMAELKKELEPEMQGVVESMLKSQENSGKIKRESQAAFHREEPASEPPANHEEVQQPQPSQHPQQAAGTEASTAPSHESLYERAPAPAAAEKAFQQNVNTSGSFELHPKASTRDSQLHTEQQPREQAVGTRDTMELKNAGLEAPSEQERMPREGSNRDEAVRQLQAKIAELTTLLSMDKQAREQLIRDRVRLEELWRERDAKVAELTARLNSDSTSRAALGIERDELRTHKRDMEARHADMEARLNSERQAKDALQRERNQLFDAHRDLDAKIADMSTRMAADRNVRDTASRSRDELAETHHELEARIADLEARLGSEKKSKETLIKERDGLSDSHRELQARIADLDSRLHSERSEKESISTKHDQHLEAKNELDAKVADLESRLHSERDEKVAANIEREKLHEMRLELEARTADLTRRHANEREAKDRVLKDHADLSTEHRDLVAKVADFKTRLKSELDVKDTVRKERDEALARADAAESRAEKAESELARLRKGINAQLDKFAAEYQAALGKLAEKTAALSAHAAQTRKHLEAASLHHGDTIEVGAAELKSKLEQEGADIGTRLRKLMQEQDSRDSTRLTAQSGSHAPLPSGQHAAHVASSAPTSSTSGRMQPIPNKPPLQPSESNITFKEPALPLPDENAAVANAGSNSKNAAIPEPSQNMEVGPDKASGTFWAKVFKRPATKP